MRQCVVRWSNPNPLNNHGFGRFPPARKGEVALRRLRHNMCRSHDLSSSITVETADWNNPVLRLDRMVPDRKLCDMTVALARMGGNEALLRQVIELVRADMPGFLNRLKAGVATGNATEVERAAHSIQGTVVTFGAEAALVAADRVERMGRAGDLSQAPQAVEDLIREIDRLDAELIAELERK